MYIIPCIDSLPVNLPRKNKLVAPVYKQTPVDKIVNTEGYNFL